MRMSGAIPAIRAFVAEFTKESAIGPNGYLAQARPDGSTERRPRAQPAGRAHPGAAQSRRASNNQRTDDAISKRRPVAGAPGLATGGRGKGKKMIRKFTFRALLAGSAFISRHRPSPRTPAAQPEPTEPDQSDATADAAIAAAQPIDDAAGQDRTAAGPGRSAPGSARRGQGGAGQGYPVMEGRARICRQGCRLQLQAARRCCNSTPAMSASPMARN